MYSRGEFVTVLIAALNRGRSSADRHLSAQLKHLSVQHKEHLKALPSHDLDLDTTDTAAFHRDCLFKLRIKLTI
ncbi:unnamed protein product [Fusarium graminearum]|uniref:Chromosome 1, complete genome n=1 Tax=Gibberella zeae (strain ATCC MYA-4620 / CBS 123657 / FGSC 9075 / NRRL 31084 / PH-1) TaxID=229533 RepID=A0A098DDA1_GIBZE|nr:unnamed protein product [Fusarium graminearum]